MIFKSVVSKLWLTIVTMVLVLLILLGFLLSQSMENFYFGLKSEELTRQGTQIAEIIENESRYERVLANIDMISEFTEAHIMIVDRRGMVQVCQGVPGVERGVHLDMPDIDRVMRGETLVRKGLHPAYNAQMLSVAVPVYQNRLIVGAVLLDAPVDNITENVNNIRNLILYAAGITVIIATIITYFLSKSINRPLIQMNRSALAMAKGNYKQKVEVTTSDEIGNLGSTLNFLGKELEINISDLSREKKQLSNVLSSMTEGVISFDRQGCIIALNPPVKEMLDLNSIFPGQTLPTTLKGVNRIEKLAQRVFVDSKPIMEEMFINEKYLKLRLAPIVSIDDVSGVVVVVSDITKEKKLDKIRKEFVANVSHELRTPLSLLQGYTEAILDGLAQTEEERENYLKIILDETLRLRRLVNELLDLTQIESGQMNLNIQTINIEELINKIKDKLEPVTIEKRITISVNIETQETEVQVDSDRIEQAIINLLDNAIKYIDENGQIEIEVSREIYGNMLIKVRDNGAGIDSEELPYIFDRFYKVDKARTRVSEKDGTGLGLSIVKNIIEAHGGSISAYSTIGLGTTFFISLPKNDME